MMARKWAYLAPLMVVGLAVFLFLGGWVVQLLWNWIVPSVIGWSRITFWQALGLLALCRILFGNLRMQRSGHSRRRRFARRWARRWSNLTPEERDRLRQRMRDRFGMGAPEGEFGAE